MLKSWSYILYTPTCTYSCICYIYIYIYIISYIHGTDFLKPVLATPRRSRAADRYGGAAGREGGFKSHTNDVSAAPGE